MIGEEILDQQDRLLEAMADAILNWRFWCHRRKDSYFPIDQDRGRFQHSMDCTPPPDASLALDPMERELHISEVQGQAIVPIAIVEKQTLIEFDLHGAGGNSLPVLTMNQNVALSSRLLLHLFSRYGLVRNYGKLQIALTQVVSDDSESVAVAMRLLSSGEYEGVSVLRSEMLNAEELLPELLKSLAKGFLLCAVVPAELLGQRTIFKMSYLWGFISEGQSRWIFLDGQRWWNSFKGRRSLRLPMTAASDTQSYHIELRVPDNVRCLGMSIPGSIMPEDVRQGTYELEQFTDIETRDIEIRAHSSPSVHLHASYFVPPVRTEAWVEVEGARNSLFWASCVGGTLVVVLGVMLTFLVHGQAIVGGQARSVSLLLSAPALFLGFVSAQGDHTLGMPISIGHRLALLGYALCLFCMAGTPLFTDSPPIAERIWSVSAYAICVLWIVTFVRLLIGKWPRLLIKSGWSSPRLHSDAERDWRWRQ